MQSEKNRGRVEGLPFSTLALITYMHFLQVADCRQKLTSWRGPSSFILGVPPTPRACHGLVTVLGNLYVFGGESGTGGDVFFAQIGLDLHISVLHTCTRLGARTPHFFFKS